jgi:transcriptional regulator with XRE-family HTH domain
MSYRRVDCISLSGLDNAPMAAIDIGDTSTLGGRVAFLRIVKDWSGARLARECEFSQNTIWMLENNKIEEPSAQLIWAVARALETTPEYIWTGAYDPDEAALIAAFRSLPPEERPAVLRAAGVTSSPSEKPDALKKH